MDAQVECPRTGRQSEQSLGGSLRDFDEALKRSELLIAVLPLSTETRIAVCDCIRRQADAIFSTDRSRAPMFVDELAGVVELGAENALCCEICRGGHITALPAEGFLQGLQQALDSHREQYDCLQKYHGSTETISIERRVEAALQALIGELREGGE